MFVEKWMTGFPVTLTPEMTISSAALKMSRYRFRHIPVVKTDSTGHTLVGMISKYDLARAFPKNLNPFSVEVSAESVPTPVSANMTRDIVTVTPDCAIEKAAWLLRERRINALPVLRRERLVGIITESDIFAALLNMSGATKGGFKIALECESMKNPVLELAEASERNNVCIQSLASFPDPKSQNITETVLHLTHRPSSTFVDELAKLGFRVRMMS